VDFVDFVDFDN